MTFTDETGFPDWRLVVVGLIAVIGLGGLIVWLVRDRPANADHLPLDVDIDRNDGLVREPADDVVPLTAARAECPICWNPACTEGSGKH